MSGTFLDQIVQQRVAYRPILRPTEVLPLPLSCQFSFSTFDELVLSLCVFCILDRISPLCPFLFIPTLFDKAFQFDSGFQAWFCGCVSKSSLWWSSWFCLTVWCFWWEWTLLIFWVCWFKVSCGGVEEFCRLKMRAWHNFLPRSIWWRILLHRARCVSCSSLGEVSGWAGLGEYLRIIPNAKPLPRSFWGVIPGCA